MTAQKGAVSRPDLHKLAPKTAWSNPPNAAADAFERLGIRPPRVGTQLCANRIPGRVAFAGAFAKSTRNPAVEHHLLSAGGEPKKRES